MNGLRLNVSKRKARIRMLLNLMCICACATLANEEPRRKERLSYERGRGLGIEAKKNDLIKAKISGKEHAHTCTQVYVHRAQLPPKDDINSFINNADFEAFVNLARPSDGRFHFPIYFPRLTASTRMKRVI